MLMTVVMTNNTPVFELLWTAGTGGLGFIKYYSAIQVSVVWEYVHGHSRFRLMVVLLVDVVGTNILE